MAMATTSSSTSTAELYLTALSKANSDPFGTDAFATKIAPTIRLHFSQMQPLTLNNNNNKQSQLVLKIGQQLKNVTGVAELKEMTQELYAISTEQEQQAAYAFVLIYLDAKTLTPTSTTDGRSQEGQVIAYSDAFSVQPSQFDNLSLFRAVVYALLSDVAVKSVWKTVLPSISKTSGQRLIALSLSLSISGETQKDLRTAIERMRVPGIKIDDEWRRKFFLLFKLAYVAVKDDATTKSRIWQAALRHAALLNPSNAPVSRPSSNAISSDSIGFDKFAYALTEQNLREAFLSSFGNRSPVQIVRDCAIEFFQRNSMELTQEHLNEMTESVNTNLSNAAAWSEDALAALGFCGEYLQSFNEQDFDRCLLYGLLHADRKVLMPPRFDSPKVIDAYRRFNAACRSNLPSVELLVATCQAFGGNGNFVQAEAEIHAGYFYYTLYTSSRPVLVARQPAKYVDYALFVAHGYTFDSAGGEAPAFDRDALLRDMAKPSSNVNQEPSSWIDSIIQYPWQEGADVAAKKKFLANLVGYSRETCKQMGVELLDFLPIRLERSVLELATKELQKQIPNANLQKHLDDAKKRADAIALAVCAWAMKSLEKFSTKGNEQAIQDQYTETELRNVAKFVDSLNTIKKYSDGHALRVVCDALLLGDALNTPFAMFLTDVDIAEKDFNDATDFFSEDRKTQLQTYLINSTAEQRKDAIERVQHLREKYLGRQRAVPFSSDLFESVPEMEYGTGVPDVEMANESNLTDAPEKDIKTPPVLYGVYYDASIYQRRLTDAVRNILQRDIDVGNYARPLHALTTLLSVSPSAISDRVSLLWPIDVATDVSRQAAYVAAAYFAFLALSANEISVTRPVERLTFVVALRSMAKSYFDAMMDKCSLGHRLAIGRLVHSKILASAESFSPLSVARQLELVDRMYAQRMMDTGKDRLVHLVRAEFETQLDKEDDVEALVAFLIKATRKESQEVYDFTDTLLKLYIGEYKKTQTGSVERQVELLTGALTSLAPAYTTLQAADTESILSDTDTELFSTYDQKTVGEFVRYSTAGSHGTYTETSHTRDAELKQLLKQPNDRALSQFFSSRRAWRVYLESVGIDDSADVGVKKDFVRRLARVLRPHSMAYSAFVVRAGPDADPDYTHAIMAPHVYIARYGTQIARTGKHPDVLVCQAYAVSNRIPGCINQYGPRHLAKQLREMPWIFYDDGDENTAYPADTGFPWTIERTLLESAMPDIAPGHATVARLFAPLALTNPRIFVLLLPSVESEIASPPVALMTMDYTARRHIGVAWKGFLRHDDSYARWKTESARKSADHLVQGTRAWEELKANVILAKMLS